MITRMYAVYDVKSLTYAPPFLAQTDGVAVRMLKEAVDDNTTMVGRHPADFKLYCIASFDDQRGLIMSKEPPEHVVDAVALVSIQPKLPLEEAAQ